MILITGISLVSIFIIIGEWVGKVAQEGQYGKTFLPPVGFFVDFSSLTSSNTSTLSSRCKLIVISLVPQFGQLGRVLSSNSDKE